jgi:lipopolysaccharide export system protein LptA
VKKLYVLILVSLFVLCPLFPVHGEDRAPKGERIHIESDRLDVYDSQQRAVFSGSVQVKQQDTVINSDELYIYYKRGDAGEKSGNNMTSITAGNIEKIEARGRVRIIQGDRIVTGDNAVLFYKEQKVIVTGDTMMQEGKNKIKGGKITFFMKEKRGTVERAEKEKVTATIYPEDEQ